jgi:predicted RNA-binding Zn ribbon-like protein
VSSASPEERPGTLVRDLPAPTGLSASDPERSAPGALELVRQFINTADLAPAEDELADLPALERWLRARDLLAARERLREGDLERALAVREALRTLVAERGAVDARTLRALNALPALVRVSFDAGGAPALEAAGEGLDRALAALLAIIDEAAVVGTWSRLKVCADRGCRWAFYDNSKNRSRSWCNMAVCGNRAKAREYRRRRSAAAAETDGGGA